VDHARALISFTMSRDDIDEVITAWNALDDLTKSLGVPLGFSGWLANRSYGPVNLAKAAEMATRLLLARSRWDPGVVTALLTARRATAPRAGTGVRRRGPPR